MIPFTQAMSLNNVGDEQLQSILSVCSIESFDYCFTWLKLIYHVQ